MRGVLAMLVAFSVLALPAAPALSQADSAEVTFWESVRDSKDVSEIGAYLKAYPDGRFAPLARIRLRALQEIGEAQGKDKAAPASSATTSPPLAGNVCAKIRCLKVVGDVSDGPVAMQARPRAWAEVVGRIPPGAQDVIPVGERATSASIQWILVEYNGVRGWVPAQFLTE